MISKSPEDLQYYEDRLKFLRDERTTAQVGSTQSVELLSSIVLVKSTARRA